MEAEGGKEPSTAERRRAGPSAAVAELTAAGPEREEPEPALMPSRWLRPIGTYVRRVTSELQCVRYG
jgi:hypothetical protein